jgi:hypothetical protein
MYPKNAMNVLDVNIADGRGNASALATITIANAAKNIAIAVLNRGATIRGLAMTDASRSRMRPARPIGRCLGRGESASILAAASASTNLATCASISRLAGCCDRKKTTISDSLTPVRKIGHSFTACAESRID